MAALVLFSQSSLITLRPSSSYNWNCCIFTSQHQHNHHHHHHQLAPASKKAPNQSLIYCTNIQHYQNSVVEIERGYESKRRDLVFKTLLATFSFPAAAAAINAPFAFADTIPPPSPDLLEEFQVYTDDVNKFKITIPRDWKVGAGDGNGIKSVTAFFPEEASNSNVSVVITGLGPDFTRLESFGKVDSFAENLVSGLDRSWQKPPGVTAKLIDSKAANGLYYIEYSLQNPGGSRRYLYSVLGMANNGWYNRLYTLTGQFVEEEADKYASKVAKAVGSFRLTT